MKSASSDGTACGGHSLPRLRSVGSPGLAIISAQALTMIIALARPLVLARLLGPDDFGLAAIALSVITAAQILTDPGLAFALIQQRSVCKIQYDSVWTLSLCRGVLLSIVLIAASRLLGNIFHDSRVSSAICAMALIPLVFGLTNVHYVVGLQRALELRKLAIGQVLLPIADFSISVLIASFTRSYWALIVGQVVSNILLAAYSFLAVSTRPSLRFDWDVLNRLFRFGRYVLLGTVLYFAFSQFDNVIVAQKLDASSLGFYKVAYGLTFFAAGALGAINNTLLFPVLSRLHREEDKGLPQFLRLFSLVFTALCLVLAGFVAAPNEIIGVFLGARWLPAATIVPILAVAAVFRAASEICVPYFVAAGRPERTVIIYLIQFVPFIVLLGPMTTRFGSVGTSWTVLASYFIGCVGNLFTILRYDARLDRMALLGTIAKGSVITLVAVVCGVSQRGYLDSVTRSVRLVTISFVTITAYALLVMIFQRRVASDAWLFVKSAAGVMSRA